MKTIGMTLSFCIFLFYLIIGAHMLSRARSKGRELFPALVSFGLIWINISITYLCLGTIQAVHGLGHAELERFLFLVSQYAGFSIFVPFAYFASYLLWGDRRLSHWITLAFLVLYLIGAGLISSTPTSMSEYSWGIAWGFDTLTVAVYFWIVGAVPVCLALLYFIFFLYPRTPHGIARYRLAMVTVSFIIILVAFSITPGDNSFIPLLSRSLLLAAGILAQLAYFPTRSITRRFEGRS
jgi:hypothetical protein